MAASGDRFIVVGKPNWVADLNESWRRCPIRSHPRKRWVEAWLHSDLIGFPVTLAAVAIAAISLGLFVVIGGAGGLFVGKLLFVCGLGGLVGLILLLHGRRGETTEAVATVSPASDGRGRVLVVANEGLESAALCEEVCARGNRSGAETMIVAPVVASSAPRALADDVDGELHEAQIESMWRSMCSGAPGSTQRATLTSATQ